MTTEAHMPVLILLLLLLALIAFVLAALAIPMGKYNLVAIGLALWLLSQLLPALLGLHITPGA
jgi:hypothetical protein